MVTREDALARAEEWLNGGRPPGQRREVGLHEFDLGYVVWAVEPEPADPYRPPDSTGAARGVIDRRTGELTRWPALPVAAVVVRYRERQAAGSRFPDDVSGILSHSQ